MTLNFGNQLFPPRGEFLVNFDYIDVVSGQGYIKFFIQRVGSTADPILTRIPVTGGPSVVDGSIRNNWTTSDGNDEFSVTVDTSTSSSFEKQTEVDFDITIKRPVNIQGIVYFQAKTVCEDISTNTLECYLVVRLRHWDGSNETEVANGQTDTNPGDGLADLTRTLNTSFDVTNKQHYKIGDVLRVTIELWIKTTGSNGQTSFAHDGLTGFINIPFDLIS